MTRPGLVATGRAWQVGSALTERSNSMDKNGTNSSSPASPIWLICLVPAVAAQAQRGPYITYSVIVPLVHCHEPGPRARSSRRRPPALLGRTPRRCTEAPPQGVSRVRPGTRAGRGLPADRGTRLMHEIIPYYAQRPAGIP